MSIVAAAAASYRREATRRRGVSARVSLDDTDTLTAGDLTPGDVFVHAGRLLVALSVQLHTGVLHVTPWGDRTAHETLALSEDEPVLVFV